MLSIYVEWQRNTLQCYVSCTVKTMQLMTKISCLQIHCLLSNDTLHLSYKQPGTIGSWQWTNLVDLILRFNGSLLGSSSCFFMCLHLACMSAAAIFSLHAGKSYNKKLVTRCMSSSKLSD